MRSLGSSPSARRSLWPQLLLRRKVSRALGASATKRRPPVILFALDAANFLVCGARRTLRAVSKGSHDVGRDQEARLILQVGLRGAIHEAGPRDSTWSVSVALARPRMARLHSGGIH